MKKLYLLMLAVVHLYFFTPLTNATEPTAQELEQIQILSSTFHHYYYPIRDQIWPDFNPLNYPAVFHYPSGHQYAFGFKQPALNWKSLNTGPIPVYFHVNETDPILQVPMNPAYLVNDQPAFVFKLNAEEEHPYFLIQTFIHERFHVFQFQTFMPERVQEAKLSDYQQISQLAWIEMENRLLTQAIETPLIDEQQNLLKDFIAVNQVRRLSLSESSRSWEDHQQKMEGMADYVSLKTFHLFSSIPKFNFKTMVLKLRHQKLIGKPALIQDAMKGRHYFVGAILGWMLDQYPKLNWKQALQTGRFTLQQLLERSLSMSLYERNERLARLKNKAEWQMIVKEVEEKLEKEKMNESVASQLFADQKGMTVWLGLPPCSTSTGGHHKQMTQVERIKVLMGDTSFSSSANRSWNLRFKNIPICLEEPTGERTFKLPADLEVSIDGQQLALNKLILFPQPILFSSLSWKDPVCDFETVYQGKIFIQEDRVQITFNQTINAVD